MATRWVHKVAALVLAVASAGCLVETREVSDPRPDFDRARRDVERVAGRPGPAHRLNVLAYDAHDRELTRVRLPLWLAEKSFRDERVDVEGTDLDDAAAQRVARRLRGRKLRELNLGVLVEVEDDGERVLVWLD